jgi:GNAT superfamily N-acetyltransferase
MIRAGGLEDEDLVVRLISEFLANSSYKNEHIDHNKLRPFLREFLTPSAERIAILSEDTGVLLAAAVEKLWSFERVATEIAFWVTPSARTFKTARELITGYEQWAETVGVKTIQLVSLDQSLDKLYTRRGYRLTEYAYVKDIS